MQWKALFHKEILENWRNKKWIWVPLVFILICIMDPISYYFLPEIMEMAGNVPEGMAFEIPEMTGAEIALISLEQLSLFGVLVVILIAMGTIASERNQGITDIILVKPIRAIHFITSKWLAYALLTFIALFIGLLANWYYSSLLFGDYDFIAFLLIFAFYSLWLLFVVSLVIFYNTFVKNAGMVVACTIGTLFILTSINMAVGHRLTWFPNRLSSHLAAMIQTDKITNELVGTSVIIAIMSICLLIASIIIFRKREVLL